MPVFLTEDNRNLVYFLIITFTFSWFLWLPSLLASFGLIESLTIFGLLRIIGSFGPLVGAFSLTSYYEGLTGVRILWNRAWHFNKWPFLLIAILLLPILNLLSLWLAVITEGLVFPRLSIWDDYMFILINFIFFFFIAGPFQEEFGWRGYALDKIQSNWNALESSMVLGSIWSLWHLPLFYISGTPQSNSSFFSFTFTVILLSIVYTWLYNNTNGSILVAMIFHAVNNISNSLFPLNDTLFGYAYYTILLDLAVVIILIIYGPKNLVRKSTRMDIRNYRKYERLIQ
ncbi:MAG: type II CAAX prenyl endopeptidase Rce1 family protein [Candidatus Heimdallarchaeota archaeon]